MLKQMRFFYKNMLVIKGVGEDFYPIPLLNAEKVLFKTYLISKNISCSIYFMLVEMQVGFIWDIAIHAM